MISNVWRQSFTTVPNYVKLPEHLHVRSLIVYTRFQKRRHLKKHEVGSLGSSREAYELLEE